MLWLLVGGSGLVAGRLSRYRVCFGAVAGLLRTAVGLLLGPSWLPLTPFWVPFVSLLCPFGSLLAPFCLPFGSLWLPIHSLLAPFASPLLSLTTLRLHFLVFSLIFLNAYSFLLFVA